MARIAPGHPRRAALQPAGRKSRMSPINVLPDGIILQGFHWESTTPDCRDPSQWPEGKVGSSWYQTVKEKVKDMREAGFTDIWLPPPSASVAREGYLPTKLYDLDSAYGGYRELRALLRELQAQGIGAILDCVLNHRCGDRQDESGNWVYYSDELAHDNRRLDWGPWAIISNHPNPALAGTGAVKDLGWPCIYHAAPNVDHSNPEVRDALISWMNYMTRPRNLGFASLRFDFARGYEGKFMKEYVDNTVWPRGELSVGEYWDDGDGGDPAYTTTEMLTKFVDSMEGHVGAFDFPTKTAIHRAALDEDWSHLGSKENGLPGLMGARPGLAFTFIDNHDTAPPQAHFPFPDSLPKLLAAHAYLLSHPGLPTVFWQHVYGKKNADGITNGKEPDVSLTEADGQIDKRNVWVPPNHPGFSWEERWKGTEPWTVGSQDAVQGPGYTGICGTEIKKMVTARSQAGITSTSPVDIIVSEKDLYHAVVTGRTVYGSAREGASTIDSVYKLDVCIGPKCREVAPPPDSKVVTAGSLHVIYAYKVSVEHEEQVLDSLHPHTYMASSSVVGGESRGVHPTFGTAAKNAVDDDSNFATVDEFF